jgi:hypothetical protein
MASVFHHLQFCAVGKWSHYRTDSRPRAALMTLYTPPVGEKHPGFLMENLPIFSLLK